MINGAVETFNSNKKDDIGINCNDDVVYIKRGITSYFSTSSYKKIMCRDRLSAKNNLIEKKAITHARKVKTVIAERNFEFSYD